MNFYEKRIVPPLIDCLCGLSAIEEQRKKVVPLASGEVLEIGIGRGLNIPYYRQDRVSRIIGLDPVLEFDTKAQKRIDASGLDVELLSLSAQSIPAETDRFDTVVCTYTLCSIDQPAAALAEMHRVLKPGGQFIFCEHGSAPDAGVARWQDRMTPAWRKIAGNCHMNRVVSNLLAASPFSQVHMEQDYIPGPRILCYNYWGTAQA